MEENLYAQKNTLRQIRELRGWTQKDLAEKLCLPDTRTLRRWENGDAFPSLRYRARLCNIFERSPEELGLISEDQQPLTAKEEAPFQGIGFPNPALSTTSTLSRLQLLPSPDTSATTATTSDQRNRQRLLEKVHAFWIKEVLEHSLHESAHLTLELREQPAAVANPWKQVIELSERALRTLPPGTSLTQLYDEACGELLLLGEPGAGKTTMILELARELLLRAGENEEYPIPVVFHLSSWSIEGLPLAVWLVEELSSKYQVPQRVGQAWVENDQILPLLDGLDEVSPAFRNACVGAINAYRRAHGLVPMVVCSRREEYLNLPSHLLLQKALYIQPPTQQQINEYLTSKNGQLKALRSALREDEELQQLVTTPLMLNVLVSAYRDQSVETLKALGSVEMRRKQIFALYVECMLKRRRRGKNYTLRQSIHWLAYLAQQMKQRGQTEFYLERMQLDWLPTRRLQQICYGVFIGLWAGLVSGGLIGLIARSLGDEAPEALVITPFLGLVVGILAGVAGSLLEGALSQPVKKVCAGALAESIVAGGTVWVGHLFPASNIIQYGVLVGLIIALVLLLLNIKDAKIEPAEVVNWSWMRVRSNVISSSALLITLLFVGIGAVGGLFGWLVPDLGPGVILLLLFGLFSFLSAGLLSGFSSKMLEKRLIVRSNQGIRRSAYYALRNGLIAGSLNGLALTGVGMVIAHFFPRLIVMPHFVAYGALAFSLTMGLIIGIQKGGEACLKHLVLRLMLGMGGTIPRNYPHFLDYAAEHILLHKIGGGYIFVHRLLLDYFASLSEGE